MNTIYIYGKNGRIGTIVQQYATQQKVSIATDPKYAYISILAVPQSAVSSLLPNIVSPIIIDMSGFSKRHNLGTYAATLQPFSDRILQNPGCFASSVIQGILRASLPLSDIESPLHIATTGGASVDHPSAAPGIRLAKRLWDHPHVQEIQKRFPKLRIASFTPIINHCQPHGIISTISGTLTKGTKSAKSKINIQETWGNAQVAWELHTQDKYFSLVCALDNLHFPACYAIRLAKEQLKDA